MASSPLSARFAAQLLSDERGADPAAVTERLLAIQAQDLRSARLAIRARIARPAAGEVERALNERTLVVGWLNRGTLQLVGRADYWWLHALTTPPLLQANARRLSQTGVSPRAAERGLAAIARALGEEGALGRRELGERVRAEGVPTAGQALVHLLMLGCLRGIVLRGPLLGKQHAYVLAQEWLGPQQPLERSDALAELARRYLRAHGPAEERDLAKWAGLPLRDARAGLDRIARELVRRDDGLVELRGSERGGAPRPCLLDQWDPLLVGWRSRAALLEDYPQRDVPAAHYRRFAYHEARAVATWSLREGLVTVEAPFVRLPNGALEALASDAADLARFLSGRAVDEPRLDGTLSRRAGSGSGG